MLEVEVKAGGQRVGVLEIERIGGQEGNDWESVFKYIAILKWQLGKPASDRSAQIQHRYGDAWPILVTTALKALISQNPKEMVNEAPTLGEIAEQLQELKRKGVTLESMMYATGQVWYDGFE